jgi:prepilin-type processing-associated H-X9-DG protein
VSGLGEGRSRWAWTAYKRKANHRLKVANILFADGHAGTRANDNERFTVDVRNHAQLRASFDKILGAFEKADEVP